MAMLAALAPIGTGCSASDTGGDSCTSDRDCPDDETCLDGMCADRPDARAGGPDGEAPDAGPEKDAGPDACVPCGEACCPSGQRCVDGTCVETSGECGTHDDCSGDRYCHPELMRCVPYGMPPGHDRDSDCSRTIAPGAFQPTVQCEFNEAPADDSFPSHMHVLSTPMVIDFGIGRDSDAPPEPSIVAVFDDGGDGSSELPTGVIRILDGESCEQQAELGSLQMVSHSSPPAVGDLDGTRPPEIVAFKANGGLVAFTYDGDAGEWTVMWRSHRPDGTAFEPTGDGWAGPSIYDLNDDGTPEVLRHGMVFDNRGELLDDSLGTTFPGPGTGLFPVIEDVDDDGLAEHVQGHGVWEWDPDAEQWVTESWSPGGTAAGHVALADFGAYSGSADWPDDAPEVAVISSGEARVQTLDGTTVFGPVAIPGGGSGGPPTVADFDGDDRPELASAGANNYAVFDLDCTGSPVGDCPSGRTDGLLWFKPSQDLSSNKTGSSVFDFEGDGRAEAVYGDECFLRVYDGTDGDVLFSQLRSSCTWYENPVIADADGDFNAEIVIGNNFNCGDADSGVDCDGLDPGAIDPLHAGLRCSEDGDCVSGRCDEGLCRCSSDDDCCTGDGCALAGYVCAPPPDGTPGEGNTCRASHPRGAKGIRVYRDAADRWVRARTTWSQHAYHVTNVNPDGTVPRTSEMRDNWRVPELNNFRQNVPGEREMGDAPDATAASTPVSCNSEGVAELAAQACNRGVEPIGDGMQVTFYEGDPADGTVACEASTSGVLEPGECERVSCDWAGAPTESPGTDITIVADDGDENGECHEENNRASLPGVYCETIG